jgi:uncharacterized YkwD family protein
MTKKMLGSILSALMMLSILSACNTQNEEVAEPNGEANYEPVQFRSDNPINNNDYPNNNRFDFTLIPGRQQFERQVPNNERNQQTAPGTDQNQNQNNNTNRPGNEETGENTANGIQEQVIQLTNQEREENGLPPLQSDAALSEVAQTKSEDMSNNNYFSHTSPTHGSPFEMMRDAGIQYESAAENIAKGQQSPEQVVTGWMNSSGHRKNILNQRVTHIGVGYDSNGNYWTQMFISK